ncbi:uncharacterized protein LOC121467563 [Drosophila elegans]|uniref:uncharacterized protein LOC121467563 n=1 Tax=Drosophila elegans TaxID=30023 RepID=UPI001BC83074|nr:uncharacterized protein LOC121467563 [Drosophila elegans]
MLCEISSESGKPKVHLRKRFRRWISGMLPKVHLRKRFRRWISGMLDESPLEPESVEGAVR